MVCGKMMYEKIQEGRKQSGLSQETLAERLDVSRQTISNWEAGITEPSFSKLKELSRELGIPLAELLGVEAQTAPQPEASEPEAAAPVVPEHRPRRWPVVLACVGVVCALVIGIMSLIGIYSINEKLEPVDTAVPMEELEGEEEDMSLNTESGTLQPLQP